MNRRALWVGLMLLSLVWIAGLGGCDGCSGSNNNGSDTVAATSGGGQSTQVLTQFANQLEVTVTRNGTAVSGVVVTFTAPAQTVASATFAGGVNTATTGANGVAMVVVSANAIAGGPYTVTATVPNGVGPANFSLTNTPGQAAGINCTSGTPQSTAINTSFANPLGVQIVDAEGNSVMTNPGFVVTFTAPAQTVASATFAGGVNTVTTGANGSATSAPVSANGIAGGPYNVTASVGIGDSTPTCNFSLTNTAVTAASITVTSGSPQSTTVTTQFGAPLVATVLDSGMNPVSGVVVTFTAPAQTGASATFAGGVNTATTGANGQASVVVSANGIVGTYTVAATVPGVAAPANFTLTNTAALSFTFYLSGLEAINEITAAPNFYGLVGAVTIDPNTGNVLTGEEDYNDGAGFTFPAVQINPVVSGLSINSTGQGTLTLVTNNALLGGVNTAAGTETLGVQFVNNDHALIMQFDGSATSSGSMDLQTLPNPLAPPSGAFSFVFSGVDPDYDPVAAGGVFSVTGGSLSGTFDFNDFGAVSTGVAFPDGANISTPDNFGRGTITNSSIAVTLNYYIVGPEAIRIIDMDSTGPNQAEDGIYDAGIGSAYGQGTTTTFSNSSLGAPANGATVFGFGSNSFGFGFDFDGVLYDAAGQFTTSSTSSSPANFSGVADDNENGEFVSGTPISGTYSICGNPGCGGNGYGSLSIETEGECNGDLQDVCNLGVYMVDPTLNISDPNNTAAGLGGALVADLDEFLVGTGVMIPQTDTSTGSFAGNYAFGGQEFNEATEAGWEWDFVGQGNFTTLFELEPGLISDPFFFFGSTSAISNATFSMVPAADSGNPGRYLPSSLTISPGPSFETPLQLSVPIYQASGDILLWMNDNDVADSFFSTFGGSIQQQTLPLTLPIVTPGVKAAAKTQTKLKP